MGLRLVAQACPVLCRQGAALYDRNWEKIRASRIFLKISVLNSNFATYLRKVSGIRTENISIAKLHLKTHLTNNILEIFS